MHDIHYLLLTESIVKDEHIQQMNVLLKELSPNALPLDGFDSLRSVVTSSEVYVAVCDDEIVGVAILASVRILTGRKDWIEDVTVRSDHRRLGIAAKLMTMAEDRSALRAAKVRRSYSTTLNLTSSRQREVARTMYKQRGYIERDTGVFRYGGF